MRVLKLKQWKVTISFILHSPSLHTCMVYDASTESANWSFYLLCSFKAMADGVIFFYGITVSVISTDLFVKFVRILNNLRYILKCIARSVREGSVPNRVVTVT